MIDGIAAVWRWLSNEAGVRFLLRRKAPFFVAVLTMGVAIGASTAAFAVLRTFLVASIGIPDAERLVLIAPIRSLPGRGDVLFFDAYPNYELIRRNSERFTDVATTFQGSIGWQDRDESRALQFARVTASFFSTMQVHPVHGRAFDAAEEGPSPAPVVIISHALWQSAMNGDSSIVGKTMLLNGAPHSVVGVMPEGFAQPAPTDLWLPFDIPLQWRSAVNGARQISIFGRLREDLPPQSRRALAQAITSRALQSSPDNKEFKYELRDLRSVLLDTASSSIILIQSAAGALLLLALLNFGSLLVAWAFDRQQEMALRLALGAERLRIVRMLFMQSALVVTLGAVVGLALTYLTLPLIRGLDINPQLSYFTSRITIDGSVLAVALAATIVAGIVIGVLPAWFTWRAEPADALRSGSRTMTLSGAALRWQQGVVVAQAALTVTVLATASMIVVSYMNANEIPPGFAPRNLMVARIAFPDDYGHGKRADVIRTLEQNLASEPSLAAFGATSTLPVSDIVSGSRFTLEVPDGSGKEPMLLHFRRITPSYLATMHIPIVDGRGFDAHDDTTGRAVIVVSKALADRLWPRERAVGKQLYRIVNNKPEAFEVVGIAGNVVDAGTRAPPGETVYMPWSRASAARVSIVFEPRSSTATAVEGFRHALRTTNPVLAPTGVASLGTLVNNANALPRLQTLLLLVFAVTAIGITAIGSYGVMSQLVANREREYALRLIFGAAPRSLGSRVYGLIARLVLPGIAVGLAIVMLLAETLRSFVFGVEPHSALLLASASIGLTLVAGVAALPPALRAMRTDVRQATGSG